MRQAFFHFLLTLILVALPVQAVVPTACTQAIVGITEGWDSSHVSLTLLEKHADGKWARVLGPMPGRLGRNGCVWGLGLHYNPRRAAIKQEGDGRSPAGIFALGGLWVTNKKPVQRHKSIPLIKVGPQDLWVSDTTKPHLYNRYVRLNHPARSDWELKEQMRQTDYPHSIKLLICHNTWETAGRPVNGAGSSIFFHIWRRDGAAPTAGCTSMNEAQLRAIIARLHPARHPVYILLPRQEYVKLRGSWRLP